MTSTSDSIQLEMLRLLKELSNVIKASRAVPNQDRSGQGSQRETRKIPKEGSKMRKNISKYYWTHGAYAHSSSHCPNQAKGHKIEATFQDKMNRSLARCE